MTPLDLAVVGIIYLHVAFVYVRDGNFGMALAFTCYAVSNVGFMLASRP